MPTGTIKRMMLDKGFGFLRATDGQEYFFHRSVVGGVTAFEHLREGDQVSFEAEPQGRAGKGPRAAYVELIDQ
jgi:cold shock protein